VASSGAAPFPPPFAEPDNPPSAAKFELGRLLFYDVRLSGNGTQSCATCHQQSRAFTDGRPVAIGSTGAHHSKNAQTLTNVAYNASFTWSGTNVRTLESQALVPMLSETPVELGIRGNEQEVVRRLSSDPRYERAFAAAFPSQRRPVSIRNAARAIAIFERQLVSWRSPYDDVVYRGKHEAMSAAATRGMHLFFSERAACSSCHGGFNLSGPVRHAGARSSQPQVVTNGVTAGKFRVPTLRNVELTGPYMHDGSITTLEEVVERYDAARALQLTAREKGDLVEFLLALTDWAFVTDERLSAPRSTSGAPPTSAAPAGESPALH
jgi:cytochrome c peroxidase